MEEKFEFNPIITDIFLYKNNPVMIDYFLGKFIIFKLSGEYFITLDSMPRIKKIGKIIIPSWDRYKLSWVLIERGVKNENMGNRI